jgi:predicted nucleotidyltransferase
MVINRETVIKELHNLTKNNKLSNIEIGLFGSYARNEQTDNSDIDVVLKGTKPLLLVYDGIEGTLQTHLKIKLGLKCDVVDYADLEADYEEAKELGLEEYTLKPVVDREAIWIER